VSIVSFNVEYIRSEVGLQTGVEWMFGLAMSAGQQ
jgi:hypothetical protein